MPTSMVVEYGDLALRVVCADNATLVWLEEFLTPAFSAYGYGPTACRIEAVADADTYRAAMQRGTRADGKDVACFAFDNGPLRLPCWTGHDGERCIWDEEAKVFYYVSADRTLVRVLIDRHRPSRRIGLMRPIRELAISSSWSPRRLVAHGASLQLGAT